MPGLFRKDLEKHCAYCAHGHGISEREVVCAYRGVTNADGCCKRFSYDALRRVPPRPAPFPKNRFSAEDFKL